MSSKTIGIKVADRTYYPVLEKGAVGRKRLVLTTVKEQQESVQIDLYENDGTEMETAQYVGSLLIENIAPFGAGEAEIELLVGVDDAGVLSANAKESTSGEHQSLSVGLESLSEGGVYDIPEFELEDELDTWDESFESEAGEELSTPTEDELDGFDEFDDTDDSEERFSDEEAAGEPKRRPVMLGLFIALGVVGVVLIAFLLFKLLEAPRVPPLEAQHGSEDQVVSTEGSANNGSVQGQEETDVSPTSDTHAAGGGPAIDRSGAAAEDTDSTTGYVPPPSEDELGGTWYWLRWGDTLWGLSSSFYRDPWLYPSIAEQNNIADPDTIFAGSRIYIPPR